LNPRAWAALSPAPLLTLRGRKLLKATEPWELCSTTTMGGAPTYGG